MPGLGIALAAIAAGIAAALSLMTPKQRAKVINIYGNWIGGALGTIAPLLDEFSGQVGGIVRLLASHIKLDGAPIMRDMKEPFSEVARAGFHAVSSGLLNKSKAGPEDWETNAADAIADAFGFGLASHSVAAAFESIFPEKLNTLNGIAPALGTLAGFEEVTGAALKPLFEATITRGARYSFNRKLRNIFPVPFAGAQLYARRLITETQLRNLFALAGLHPDFEDATVKGVYRPISPRALSTLATDTEFDWDKLREAMRYGGSREQDIDLMIAAFQAKALQSFQAQARAAVIANYEFGIIADIDLASDLDAIDQATDRRTLVRMTMLDKRLLEMTKDYLADWDAQVASGEISLVQYQTALHGIGIVDPRLTSLVAKAEGKMSARGFTRELAAETAAAHRTQLLAVQAAMTGYKNRALDEKQLTAALLLAGVSAAQAALYLALAKARGQKKLPKNSTPPASGA